MSRTKKYFRSIRGEIGILIFSMLTFGAVWILSGVDLEIYIYTCALVSFFVSIIWGIKYVGFAEEFRLKEELEEVRQQKLELENLLCKERKDVQEYFLLWIHQMKTPITAADLLTQGDEQDPETRIRMMRQELVRIESYSNMAMNYLKLIDPGTDLEFDLVDLDDIIRPLIKRYSIFFISAKIKLDYNEVGREVLSDGKWLSVLIEQILSNAVKYAKGASVHIYFSDDRLYIRDTGIGISEVDLPKIFDKGYSGFNGRLNAKSTGLGLFLVKRIAERLDHRIEVRSKLNEGTTFSIEFQEIKNSKGESL
ncbi:MAG: sensor histidine kinase [Peptostreptococcaceae bacterium]|nr:sensor histidine kinase [Peptostreptococcaceae bacterium]